MKLINTNTNGVEKDNDNKSIAEKSSKNESMNSSIKPNTKKQTLK